MIRELMWIATFVSAGLVWSGSSETEDDWSVVPRLIRKPNCLISYRRQTLFNWYNSGALNQEER